MEQGRPMSPEGRNHARLSAPVLVAACPDDQTSCPATTSSPSERNHALWRLATFPVGEEADPPCNRDPPLNHRAPERGFCHSPDAWIPFRSVLAQAPSQHFAHACSTEL